jgi:hypothetical protein
LMNVARHVNTTSSCLDDNPNDWETIHLNCLVVLSLFPSD